MRRLRVVAALILGLTLVPPACSKTGSHTLTCQSAEVSPGEQPGEPTARKALDWFVKNKAAQASLDTAGYRLESHSKARYIYAAKQDRISVSQLPTTDKKAKPIWVVLVTFNCGS